MEKFMVTKCSSLRGIKPFSSYTTESMLFIKDHDLLKFLKDEYKVGRENVITRLESIKHVDMANPLYLICDDTGFLGYGMHYYERYGTFNKYILDSSIPFEDKKRMAIRLCKLFIHLEKNKFAFDDIHPGNIIFLDDDIKLVDLDSGLFYNKNNKLEYDTRIRIEQNRLAKLCLSLLYCIHPFSLESDLKEHKYELLDMLPSNVKELYSQISNERFSHFDCLEPISQMTEDIVDETKLILKKS